MGKKRKKLLKAIRPFVSNRMRQYLEEHPDDTPVRLEVICKNGYGLTITLGGLRKIWTAYDSYAKVSVDHREITLVKAKLGETKIRPEFAVDYSEDLSAL